jgi:outer membrane protein OmpA-like peptidoglycan-associated protein
MKHGVLLLSLLLIMSSSVLSQKDTITGSLVCDSLYNSGDCDSAIKIIPVGRIGFRCAPKGFGNISEIRGKGQNSKYFIEKEHNTVWLKFTVPIEADFAFKLLPLNKEYDYDFLLFKDNGDFENRLKQNRALLVRSNLSRFDPNVKSITGLWPSSKNDFARSGPGNYFSSTLPVKKGESYYLLIDNVYGGDAGFILMFKYFINKKIEGVVLDDETSKPVKAKVTWVDASGELYEETTTDAKTGKYEMTVPVDLQNKSAKYVLTAIADGHFFSEKVIRSKVVQSPSLKPINLILPKLKRGKNVVMHNVNFYGGSPTPLPKSKVTMKKIKQLMAKNKNLVIQIEGHTNGCQDNVPLTQKLSEDRASRIKKYLVENGIAASRISTIGYNCSRMLYPDSKDAIEQMLNRRIEIKVVSF